jgi:hypothetical protein
MAGSMGTRDVMVAAPDAVEVADAAKRSTDATTVSHPVVPVSRAAERPPVAPVSRPAPASPTHDPAGATIEFSCQGFGRSGAIKVMCPPQ